MSFDPYEFDRGYASSQRDTIGQYTAKTFLWMMLGLLVTFGVAVGCWVSGATIYSLLYVPAVHIIALIAPIVLSLVFVHRIEKMSVGGAIGIFMAYAAILGYTMSIYLLVYDVTALVLCFLLTAVYFGALAAYGYLTKRDLSGIRPVLISGAVFLLVFWLLSLLIPGVMMFERPQTPEKAALLSGCLYFTREVLAASRIVLFKVHNLTTLFLCYIHKNLFARPCPERKALLCVFPAGDISINLLRGHALLAICH